MAPSRTCEQHYTIRPASGHDADALSALAFRSKAHWGYSAEFMAACREELTYTAAHIDAGQQLFNVALDAHGMAGFYALGALDHSDFELAAMFVEPAHIGRGCGRLLWEHAKACAMVRGAVSITIQADPYAEGFYRAMGGVVVGVRESESIAGRQLPLLAVSLRGRDTLDVAGDHC